MSQSHGLLHVPSRFFFSWPGLPGTVVSGWGLPGGHATRSVPQPPTPSQFLPSPTTRRKGACSIDDTPLMNINNRACALFRVLRRGGQPESRLPDRRSGSLREPGGHASLCYLQPAGELGSVFFFSSPPSPAFHAADLKGNKRLRIIIIIKEGERERRKESREVEEGGAPQRSDQNNKRRPGSLPSGTRGS